MKKRVVSILLIAAIAAGALSGCGKSSASGSGNGGEEGKVINIYSWNDEFRERVEAVYPEVKETSSDGTVTTLTTARRSTGSLIRIMTAYTSRT